MADDQVSTMWPAPNLPNRKTCSAVITAQVNMPAKTPQTSQVSSRPAARKPIATLSTVGARTSAAPWKPTINATIGGQASSGSY